MSAERAEARRALLDVLDAHAAAGRTIPCREHRDAGWTSDDPAEQAATAGLCEPCPAIDGCRLYGTAYPKEAGIYGGLTEHDRRPSRAPRTKEAA